MELQEELKRTKNNDAAEIMRLKKELATLREVLRNYIMQIDSLNRLNQQLNTENENLRSENEQAQQHISNLTTEKENLTDKVAIASQLDATGISAIGKNKRGRTTSKVKDVKKFQISFTISRNVTAKTGMKSVYVRILTPTNETLTQGRHLPLREPPDRILHPQGHRIHGRGTKRHRLLGHRRDAPRRTIPRGHLRRRTSHRRHNILARINSLLTTLK